MSESTQKKEAAAPGIGISRSGIAEMLSKNFERLPDIDQKLFIYGPLYLAGNAGLAGLISNSLYRRALHVKQGPIATSLPMAVLPFLTTYALYNAAVSGPLLTGDLNCPSCVLLRGALVGVVGGGLYPIILALPMNLGMASTYNTTPMPEKGHILKFSVEISKPVMRKMRAVLLLQALFGTYLSSRHFDSYTKLAELTFGRNREELKD
ncbi:transmembrane protein 126A [Nelusetta ayraudi]|uniref:transmembrane protein 126A n=1 Tax=Nelusetta ayraudi TaxID=303726 RepID=UPI003F704A2E